VLSKYCSLALAMDGRIMRHGVISSCQSAATSEIVKSDSCKQRYSKYLDLYFTLKLYIVTDLLISRN